MSNKKISPREAAILVLKKAEELYKASTLAKGDWAKIHSKLKREGYSEESADKIDGAIKAKMGKSEDLKKDAPMPSPTPSPAPMPTINQQIGNPFGKAEGGEAPMKGHIKLAKFMGAMEAKRGQRPGSMDKGEPDRGKETGYEKGVNTKGNFHAGKPGQSHAGDKIEETSYLSPKGSQAAVQQAKGQHKQVLSDMKAMPKPKLPG